MRRATAVSYTHLDVYKRQIMYDEASGYYYLFVSYGALTSNGGYQVRVFRSKTVDGEYVEDVYKRQIEDVTTSGKSMEETVPKVRGAADVTIVGLMVSLNRMEVGQGGKVSAVSYTHLDVYKRQRTYHNQGYFYP